MEELLDPFQYGVIPHLSVPQFLNLCQTSKTFATLCDNPDIWTFFIHRDLDEDYREDEPKEDYIYKTMIKDMRETGGNEKIWKMMDLVGYGLDNPVPNIYYLTKRNFDSPDALATRRLVRLIADQELSPEEFPFASQIRKMLSNTVRNQKIKNSEISKLTGNIISQGSKLYDYLASLPPSKLGKYIRAHKDDVDLGFFDIMNRTTISDRYNDPVIQEILITHLDDPVMRNL